MSNIDEGALQAAVMKQVAQNLRNQLEADLDQSWVEEPIWRSMKSMRRESSHEEAHQLGHHGGWGKGEISPVCHSVLRRLRVCYGVNSVKELFLRGVADNDQMVPNALFEGMPAIPLPKSLMDNLFLKATDPDVFQDILLTEKLNECVKTLHGVRDKKPKEWDADFLMNVVFGTTVFIAAVTAMAFACLPDADSDVARGLNITSDFFYLLASFAIFSIAMIRASEHKERKKEHGIHETLFQALEYEFWPAKEVEDGYGDVPVSPIPLKARLVESHAKQAALEQAATHYRRAGNPYRKTHFM